MRISDWSSDVCSSDLVSRRPLRLLGYSRQIVESNWKLYWENSRDPYHATLMHPFLSTFGILRTDGDYHSVPLQEGRHEYTYSQYDPELKNRTSEASKQIKSIRRSEEHTSELQSLMRISYAVFCLKKNK